MILPKEETKTYPHAIFVLLVYFDWLYLFEMTRPKKSTTTTLPLKSQDASNKASNKASKSDSGAELEGAECEEYVTLGTLKQILSIQESTLKSIFKSFIMSVNHRVDDLVKTVAEVKSSLKYTQRDVVDLGQMAAKLKDAEEEIGTLQTDLRTQDSKLEYLENQSRKNKYQGIRDPGIAQRNLGGR